MAEIKVLEDKKIVVKPIVRGRAFTKKGHDGEFMFTGCKERFTLPFVKNTNSFKNIFGSGAEGREVQKAFEELLNQKPGALSLYDRKNPFWAKFWVELSKNDKTLELDNPRHALEYRVLLANVDIIAPDWESRKSRPSYKWAIVDELKVIEKESKSADRMLTAMTLFQKVQTSQKKMLDILRLLEKKPKSDATKDWLQKELTKIIAQIDKTPGAPNIDDFIKAASDPQASDKIFVLDAIEAKAIVVDRNENEFREVDTNKLLGRSLQGVVDHYSDAMFQEDRLLIEEKIKRSNR